MEDSRITGRRAETRILALLGRAPVSSPGFALVFYRQRLLDVIVFNESSLRRLLNLYFSYYLRSRTHLALGKDSPVSRPVQPREVGAILELPEVGGLHHRYERHTA